MKTTKIMKVFISSESVCCPYCQFSEFPPEEFYELENESDFEIIKTCTRCNKEYKINSVEEF